MNQNGTQKKVFCRFLKQGNSLLVKMILCLFLSTGLVPAFASGNNSVTEQPANQTITLKNKVVDKKNGPIIGATVVVEGSTKGTITDIDGNFTLEVPSASIIAVSFIGFKTLKLPAQNVLSMNGIVLEESMESLDEVMVVGYGQVKRANLTGAVSNVEMKKLEDIPAPSLSSVLLGAMSGVSVSEVTGNPLAEASIKVRINGSWNSDDPLFVIDGFIRDVNAFNQLDPSEIDNISVLKDAAAAIYGVRGSDGVLLVTTRRGKEGKTKISYSGSYGVSDGVNMPEMMSAFEQATALNHLYRENLINGTSTSVAYFSPEELDAFKNIDNNWLEMGWKSSQNTRHTLNISGGTDKVKYNISGSYMFSDGNFAQLNMNRYNFRSGLDVDFTEQLSGNFTLSFSQRSTDSPLNEKDAEPDRMYGTFSDLCRQPRWVPAYIDGLAVGNGLGSSDTHPLEVFNSGSFRKNYSNDVTLSGKINYEIKKIKGLKASFSIDYSRGNSNGKQLAKPYKVYNFVPSNQLHFYDINGNQTIEQPIDGHLYTNVQGTPTTITNGDKLYESATFDYSYQITPSISYANKFKFHDINAVILYEQSESGGNNLNWTKTGLAIDGINSATGYSTISSVDSKINTLSRRQGFIGRFNYTYADKYSFESTARYEASTNFAKGYRWGLFPSLAASWRISEESFFKDKVKMMDLLKLRFSYGLLGNDKLNSISQYRETFSTAADKYMFGTNTFVTGISPIGEGLVILNSTWEKTQSFNFGIDTRFFQTFTFSIDGFYKHSYDILDEKKSEFPQNSGIASASPKLNFGIQNAWGGEIEIGYQKDLNQDWGINANVNLSWADSRVVRKSQNLGILGTWQDEEGRRRGGETGYWMWKGVNNDGLARSWDDVHAYADYLRSNAPEGSNIEVLGLTESAFRPGMLMFKDVGTTLAIQEPDGKITADGDVNIISPFDSAPFTYSFKLGFKYKKFKFDALFDGSFGHDVIFDKGFYTDASGGKRTGSFLSATSNQLREWYGNYAIADPTTGELTNAATCIYPRLDSRSFKTQRSEFWMRNGHNLRLRNINVSYTLPASYAKAMGLESLRIFGTGTNLLTLINPYPYKDANVGFWSDYPQVRSFNLGINITL